MGSSAQRVTPDLSNCKNDICLRRNMRRGNCLFNPKENVPDSSILLTLMTSVWMLVCGQWYLGIFSFCSTASAVTALSSGSPPCSQIPTLMCFIFFSSAGPIEILEIQVEGMLISYNDRPWLITDEPEMRPSKNKSANGFNQQKTIATNSYFWTLNTLQACYCETEEIAKAVTVCKCIQTDEFIVQVRWYFCYVEMKG